MSYFQNINKEALVKKIAAVLSIIGLIYLLGSMINILLLTFIFTFIFYQISKFMHKKLNKWVAVSNKLVTIIWYAIMLVFIIIISIKYIPQITKQLIDIVNLISTFNIKQLHGKIDDRVFNMIKEIQILDYIRDSEHEIIETLKNVGTFSIDIVLALILSFFFLIEREEIMAFGKRLENSKLSQIYSYYKYFGSIFLNSFGKVIELQIVIAFINSILSVVALVIMGFPKALGLGAMIFILGLIPLAGVIISLIPLSIIAVKIGGVMMVIKVLVMIAVLHALEGYVLNPKLMSMKTKLPVFMTFIILLVGEHLMGVWGLLLGIPLFMFFLEVFDIKVREQ